MARIRHIKPDFFESEDVSGLPLRARLTWIGLWVNCDDHGRHKDIGRLIKGRIWSMDDVSLRDVEHDLAVLNEAGRIVRYTIHGRHYLAVTNWHKHQHVGRPSGPKHPAPPYPVGVPEPGEPGHCGQCWEDEQNARPDSVSEDSLSPHGGLTEDSLQERERERGEGKGKGNLGDELADDDEPRPEVDALCAMLADRIEANGAKRPTITKKWRDATRLMIDRDERTPQQIAAAIDWSQSHEFWRANVLSMPKLREKYDTLRMQATRANTNGTNRQEQADAMFDRAMARAQAREAAST